MTTTATIGIIVFDGVLTSEVIGPAEVFAIASKEPWFAGSKVLLIGIEQKPTIRTEEGITITVDATIADDLTLDVILVPGGNDMTSLINHGPLNAFIKRYQPEVQWMGSMCSGAFLLGHVGVLDHKEATTWFGGESSLQTEFPAVRVIHNQPVVLDKHLITANGGLVSYQAALVLLGKLSSPDHAKEIYATLGMDRLGSWAVIESTIVNG